MGKLASCVKKSNVNNERNCRKELKIAHLNITSLRKHKMDLEALMHEHQLDILGLNETRLNKQIDDRDVRVDGYDIYRNDRDASGGGAALYVNSSLPHHRRDDVTDPQLEILGAEITPKHAKSFVILSWYHPPTPGVDTCSFEALTRLIKRIDSEGKEVILIGDTNCDWDYFEIGHTQRKLFFC